MPISLPSAPTYQSGKWRMISNARRFRSPITRVGQSVARVGDFWAATLTVPPIRSKTIAGEWAAFLAQIVGGAESFYLYPPITNLHSVAGTPRVNGADQTGQTINLDGFTPGDTLRAGGFISYDTATFRMLHIVAATTVANGSGQMALPIRPMIRKSPADDALVNVTQPTCEMVLESGDADLYTLTDAIWYGQTLNVIEGVRE